MECDAPEISRLLDKFHLSASAADGHTYFDLFAPDGVFIGTDDSERWTLSEFKKFAEPHFSQGKGWSYLVAKRHVSLSAEGAVAWFDEQLDNAILGRTRGSGVLVKIRGDWKVAQYVLSIPIPNDLAKKVVSLIVPDAKEALGR